MNRIRVKWVQLLKPPHSSCVSCSNLEMLLTMIKIRKTEETLRGLKLLNAVKRLCATVGNVLVCWTVTDQELTDVNVHADELDADIEVPITASDVVLDDG